MFFFYFFLLSNGLNECKDESTPDPFSSVDCGSDQYLPITSVNQSSQNFSEDFSKRLNDYILNQIPKYFFPNTSNTNLNPRRFDREQNRTSSEMKPACYFLCNKKNCQSPIQFPADELCLNPQVTQNAGILLSFEKYRNTEINPSNYNASTPIYDKFLEYKKDPSVFVDLINLCVNYYKESSLSLNTGFLDSLFAKINFCQYAQMPDTSTSITAKFIQEKQKNCNNLPLPTTPRSGSITNTQVLERGIKRISEINTSNRAEIPEKIESKIFSGDIITQPSTPNTLPVNNKVSSTTSDENNTSNSVTNPTVAPTPSPQVSSPTISLTALLGFLQALMPGANTPTPYAPPPQSYTPNYSQYGMPYPAPMGPIGLPAVVNNPLFMMQGFSGYGYPMPYVWSPFVPGFFNPYNSNPPPENPKSNEIPTPSTQPASDNPEPNWFRSLLNSF